MMITLLNCKPHIEALGIDMQQTGSNELLGEKISEKVTWLSWEYNMRDYILYITVEDGIEVPDLSELGEIQNDGY
jgi:hypothetical protein